MADKKRNEFLTVDVGRKSQSHICRRLLDGHLGRRRKATDENSRDERTNSIHAQGFYVYLEVITSHNPLFRAIILFAVWIAADLNAVAELLWTLAAYDWLSLLSPTFWEVSAKLRGLWWWYVASKCLFLYVFSRKEYKNCQLQPNTVIKSYTTISNYCSERVSVIGKHVSVIVIQSMHSMSSFF